MRTYLFQGAIKAGKKGTRIRHDFGVRPFAVFVEPHSLVRIDRASPKTIHCYLDKPLPIKIKIDGIAHARS